MSFMIPPNNLDQLIAWIRTDLIDQIIFLRKEMGEIQAQVDQQVDQIEKILEDQRQEKK